MSQNVIITHVIMIVNQKMGSKNRDFAKYKKLQIFFNSHSRFEISMENYSEKRFNQIHNSKKIPPFEFLAIWQ